MSTSSLFTIRPAQKEDAGILSNFMNELAAFDGHKGCVDPQRLTDQMFRADTNVRAFLGLRQNVPIGFILCYECFTVYYGERGLYIPGAYIVPEHRNRGYGVRLFQHLAAFALEQRYAFVNWIVEANNHNAQKIYAKMGAEISPGWSYVRIPHEILVKAVTKVKK